MQFINLISGPRNISTALMYSFAQRPDTLVVDEPYYAVYLSKTSVNHPGQQDVLKAQSTDERVVNEQLYQDWSRPVLFIKNMAHHIEILDKAFLNKVTNVFLIRNPMQIIASYAEVIKQPIMRDIGIQYQFQLFTELQRNGQRPVVIDSGLILENPASVLEQACKLIGLPYYPEMLQWPAGPKSYDGVWAPHWYENVHRSTGFARQPTSSRTLPDALLPLYHEAAGYYEKLLTFALRP